MAFDTLLRDVLLWKLPQPRLRAQVLLRFLVQRGIAVVPRTGSLEHLKEIAQAAAAALVSTSQSLAFRVVWVFMAILMCAGGL